MNKDELGKKIMEIAHLTGEFKLRSGQTSNEYFDKYRFESQPELLKTIGELLAPMVPPGTQLLAGLEMGGIPIATALSMTTGIPQLLVRKEAKSYGTCQLAEGAEVKGKQVLVVEDVVTTGGQVVISTGQLRDMGAKIDHVICVIHRGEGHPEKFVEVGLQLQSLFTMNELKSLK